MFVAVEAPRELLLQVMQEDRARGWVGPTAPNGWTLAIVERGWVENLDGSVDFLLATDSPGLLLSGEGEQSEWTRTQPSPDWAARAATKFGVPANVVHQALAGASGSAEGLFIAVATALGMPAAPGMDLRRTAILVPRDPQLALAIAQGFAPMTVIGPRGQWSVIVPQGDHPPAAESLARAATRLAVDGAWAPAIQRTGPECIITVVTVDSGTQTAKVPSPGWTPVESADLSISAMEAVRAILRLSDRPTEAERLYYDLGHKGGGTEVLARLIGAGFLPPLDDVLGVPDAGVSGLGQAFTQANEKALAGYEKGMKSRDKAMAASGAPQRSSSENFWLALKVALRMRSMVVAVFGLVAVLTGIGLMLSGSHSTGQSGLRATPIGLIVLGGMAMLGGLRRAFRH